MDDAISDMNGRELDGRVISVNKAKPKTGDEDASFEYGRDHVSGGSHRGGDRLAGRSSDCFKCGRPGHFARECPLGDAEGRFTSQFGSGRGGGRGDRFRLDPYDDRISRGRYADRDYLDTRDSRYVSYDRDTSDRYSDRYAPAREGYASDRYVDLDLQNEYGGSRGYFRVGGPRPGGDRYGSGGPDRSDRGRYRDRTDPYDRHRRGDHLSSYDQY